MKRIGFCVLMAIVTLTAFTAKAQTCVSFGRAEFPNGAGKEWVRLHEKSFVLINQFKREEALVVERKALKIAEEKAGLTHPDVATSLNRLGLIHMMTGGDAAHAEPLLRRSLRIFEVTFGSESVFVADTLYLLSEYYGAKKDSKREEVLFFQAVAIYEKKLDQGGIDFAPLYNNLASRFMDKGEHRKALQFYQKSLAIHERCLGRDHRYVASDLSGIAHALARLRDYEAAETNLRRAIGIVEKLKGKESAEVASYLTQLAYVVRDSGRIEESNELHARVSEINAKRKR